MSHKRTVNKFEIDSGKVFSELLPKWKRYNEKFLVDVLQKALIEILTENDIVTLASSQKNERNIKSLFEESFKDYDNKYGNNKSFPFEPFFFKRNSKSTFPYDYVEFKESCLLNRSDKYFDLFFVLRITLTDVSDIKSLLDFHLANTFGNNNLAYVSFLNAIRLKYSDVLHTEYAYLLDAYISSFADEKSAQKGSPKKMRSEFSLFRKILFLHYIFDEFNVYQKSSKAEVARIFQLLIEKEVNATEITNTNYYKFLNQIVHKEKVLPKKDLIFVMDIFDSLDIHTLVAKIRKEIDKKK